MLRTTLNRKAKAWWYHAQLRQQGNIHEARKREHDSIRSTLGSLRGSLHNGGFLQIGRGGWTLHVGDGHTLSGYNGVTDDETVVAAKEVGIPWCDARTIPDGLIHLAIRFPMAQVRSGKCDPAPWGPLSHAPFGVIFQLFWALGATIGNYKFTEADTPRLRKGKAWEIEAIRSFISGNEAGLMKAMIDSRQEQ